MSLSGQHTAIPDVKGRHMGEKLRIEEIINFYIIRDLSEVEHF